MRKVGPRQRISTLTNIHSRFTQSLFGLFRCKEATLLFLLPLFEFMNSFRDKYAEKLILIKLAMNEMGAAQIKILGRWAKADAI